MKPKDVKSFNITLSFINVEGHGKHVFGVCQDAEKGSITLSEGYSTKVENSDDILKAVDTVYKHVMADVAKVINSKKD